ncbi:hypothetical protein EDD29_6508 [Actinocorallia herbida]|uniref:Uncharacterized protein n=1 Tax=Actinocorallia herbida TaxID=58109 RepID=A0A3N1D5V2_9ACTN|nr:hypothetical protein [Actinocorallia herbida]ROO88826.1 hypothetical protein EDD29_6508 [Actinocorallia herbida]
MGHSPGSGPHEAQEAFRTELAGRAVWKLLVKSLDLYLPGHKPVPGDVRFSSRPGPAPVFADASGFGFQFPRGVARREVDREIFVRGDRGRLTGIAIRGPYAAVGSRVVDAASLTAYARRLTYQTLFDPHDADTAGSAVRAAKSLSDVVFLDDEKGLGLGVELDRETGRPHARLLVRMTGDGVVVQAYPEAGRTAQAVRSQN